MSGGAKTAGLPAAILLAGRLGRQCDDTVLISDRSCGSFVSPLTIFTLEAQTKQRQPLSGWVSVAVCHGCKELNASRYEVAAKTGTHVPLDCTPGPQSPACAGASAEIHVSVFGLGSAAGYSTVTLFARLRGWSTSVPLST